MNIVDPKQGRRRVPPSLPCPTCHAYVTVTDDVCVTCGRCFRGGELWELYEARYGSRYKA